MAGSVPPPGSVGNRLIQFVFAGEPLPFQTALIDFGGIDYRFTSEDIGGLVVFLDARRFGRRRPCAIVMTGEAANHLRGLLRLVEFNQFQEFRVVNDRDSAMAYLVAYFKDRSHTEG